MTVNRQDAWSEDDDLLLAEVILRHIRDGSTQLKAFEEVADNLSRTAAACGFRWNSVVRKRYEAAIDIAKAQRKAMKNNYKNKMVKSIKYELDNIEIDDYSTAKIIQFDDIFKYLKQIKAEYYELKKNNVNITKRLSELDAENKRLLQECSSLKNEKNQFDSVSEDYKALIQIIDRARRLSVLEEVEEHKPKFKMDMNGNLERV